MKYLKKLFGEPYFQYLLILISVFVWSRFFDNEEVVFYGMIAIITLLKLTNLLDRFNRFETRINNLLDKFYEIQKKRLEAQKVNDR